MDLANLSSFYFFSLSFYSLWFLNDYDDDLIRIHIENDQRDYYEDNEDENKRICYFFIKTNKLRMMEFREQNKTKQNHIL